MKKTYELSFRYSKKSSHVNYIYYRIFEAYNIGEARSLAKEFISDCKKLGYEYVVVKLRWCGYVR